MAVATGSIPVAPTTALVSWHLPARLATVGSPATDGRLHAAPYRDTAFARAARNAAGATGLLT